MRDYVDECDAIWEAQEAKAAQRDAMIEDYLRNMDASEIEDVIKFDADILAEIWMVNKHDAKQLSRLLKVQIDISLNNWAERAVDEKMGFSGGVGK